jgi:hypothetical protein
MFECAICLALSMLAIVGLVGSTCFMDSLAKKCMSVTSPCLAT